ncbi:hypothetical protein NQ315_002049 [Exocentrus adspersus]|uniref:BTB domain-containing protein n=1 Tax=Exocentrus adspersus TaxID=1586481 RepID=A0AAV8VFP4_9CUCU|nr:hypothetical protein NQ315_002049 [Exocentrus adspersus]
MSEGKFEATLNALNKCDNEKTLLKLLLTIRKDVEWPKNRDNIIKLREKGSLSRLVIILQKQQKTVLNVVLSILGNCFMDRGCARDIVGSYNILSILNHTLKRHTKEDSINGRIFRILGNMCQHRDQWGNIIIDRKPQIVTYIVEFIKKISKDDIPEAEDFSEATVTMAVRALSPKVSKNNMINSRAVAGHVCYYSSKCKAKPPSTACLHNGRGRAEVLLNCQTIMTLVKMFGVLKAVGALFIKYSLEWQENKKNENILINIIKLFQDYSRYKYYHSIIEMRNTDRGDSLIHLSNVLVLAPKRVVKIVMNFIKISQLKSELPIPEICDRFIEVLRKYPVIKEFDGECVEYLQCLCYLLEHPANRNSERCGRSIPLLIQLLHDFQDPSNKVFECCILLISTLNKFRYDDILMLEQLKCNIIQVLLKKLHWLVGTSKTLNIEHKHVKKRKNDFSSSVCFKKQVTSNSRDCHSPPGSSYGEFRAYSPSSSDEDIDIFRNVRDPSPCSSSDSDMPFSWTSPWSSPNSLIHDISDYDSDNYSPICSEVDNSEFPLPLLEEDVETSPNTEHSTDISELQEDKSLEHLSDKNVSLTLKVRLLTEIIKLLKTYTKLSVPTAQLASEELLVALLKCSGNFEWTFSYNIDTIELICRILDSHDYLIPMMQTEFIQTVYDLTDLQHRKWCVSCSKYVVVGQTILKKFTALAESEVGKGDIAHKLMRGDSELKQKLVLVIPYIVKDRYILGRFMLNCGGLEILMKLLKEDTDLKKRSIKVLCAMASRKLEIANPKDVSAGLNRPKIVADKYKLSDKCVNIVTFKLDDETFLKADRDFLSEKSDFFNRLLNGDFKESTEDIICLHNVELKPLRCLLHLLECVDKSEVIEIDLDLETLLEVIVLSDRYLMVDLCVSLTDCVEQFKISPHTVPTIYQWSLESRTNFLRVESIAFALVENISESERLKMFENLFALGYSEQLVEDIQKLLVRYLTCRMTEFEEFTRKKNKMMSHLRKLRDKYINQCF